MIPTIENMGDYSPINDYLKSVNKLSTIDPSSPVIKTHCKKKKTKPIWVAMELLNHQINEVGRIEGSLLHSIQETLHHIWDKPSAIKTLYQELLDKMSQWLAESSLLSSLIDANLMLLKYLALQFKAILFSIKNYRIVRLFLKKDALKNTQTAIEKIINKIQCHHESLIKLRVDSPELNAGVTTFFTSSEPRENGGAETPIETPSKP